MTSHCALNRPFANSLLSFTDFRMLACLTPSSIANVMLGKHLARL
jgi:hypothetical protein